MDGKKTQIAWSVGVSEYSGGKGGRLCKSESVVVHDAEIITISAMLLSQKLDLSI